MTWRKTETECPKLFAIVDTKIDYGGGDRPIGNLRFCGQMLDGELCGIHGLRWQYPDGREAWDIHPTHWRKVKTK